MSDRKPSIFLLAFVASLSPFAMAIVLPALPAMVERFDTDYAEAQFVVSVYLVGLGLSQLMSGFLCDRFGRRPVAITGYVVFVATSAACIFADSIAALIPLRFLQAAGVSAGTVVARAVVRDIYSQDVGARAMSYITIGLGTAPVIAPMLGGWLSAGGDMAGVFQATTAVGVIALILILFQLPETRDANQPPPRWSSWLSSYGVLLGSAPFMGYTMIYGFVQGSFFAFLAVGASVFEVDFGLDARAFGIVWGLMATAYVVGATVGGRLSTGRFAQYLLPAAVFATPAGGIAMFALVNLLGTTPATVLIPLAALMVLSGVATPQVLAGAVYQHPALAGTAAGLSSAIGLVIGSSFTVASGFVYDGRFEPVATLILLTTCMTAAGWFLIGSSRSTGA